MPIIPERNNARRGSRSALHSQFWESQEHSSRYIDGVAWKLPCEPSSMTLHSSSGISRSQQLIAAHSLGIPVVPSYDQHGGGVVLDRSVFKVGGERWWSVVHCRVKAQRMYTEGASSSEWFEPLKNPSNYALCSRTKITSGPLALDNVMELTDVKELAAPMEMIKKGAVSTHSSIKCNIKGHTICGSISANLDDIECTGDYARVPKSVSLDIATENSQDGLQYRVGMYQVTAPSLEMGSDGNSHHSMRTALHAQGAVAVEGEAYIWKRKAKPQQDGARASVGAVQAKDASPAVEESVSEEFHSKVNSNNHSSVASDEMSVGDSTGGIHNFVGALPGEPDVGLVSQLQGKSKLLPITSMSVSSLITSSLDALENIRSNVAKMTEEVQEGSLQRLAHGSAHGKAKRSRPYSFLLSQPHVKIAASLGCLVRMPLPNQYGIFARASASEASTGPVVSSISRALNASTASLTSKGSISSQIADVWEPYLKRTTLRVFSSIGMSAQIGKFTKPLFDFSSLDVKLDLGLNSQHVVGSLPTAGAASAIDMTSRPDKHRAFALEGKGIWHCCTISAAQQIYGPIRARADFRFALDPTNVPQDQGERSTLKGIAQTALSVRPSLLESVYGGDILIPGTEGVARLALWWAPKRKEGMVELRLF